MSAGPQVPKVRLHRGRLLLRADGQDQSGGQEPRSHLVATHENGALRLTKAKPPSFTTHSPW